MPAIEVDGVAWSFDYTGGKRHVCPCGRPYRSEPKEWCLSIALHHQHGDDCCEATWDDYGYDLVKRPNAGGLSHE